MTLQNLADIHTAWYAQRIQHDLYRLAAGQERHILSRGRILRNYTLVTMTTGHLIAFANLTLLSDMYTDLFINSRRKFITVITSERLSR
jgi:hypothetical protein